VRKEGTQKTKQDNLKQHKRPVKKKRKKLKQRTNEEQKDCENDASHSSGLPDHCRHH
jgi:hypothetical protein